MFLSTILSLSIYCKPQSLSENVETKSFHLLDDSEIEELGNGQLVPSPTRELPLQASQQVDEDSTLLTRSGLQLLSQLLFYLLCRLCDPL